MCSLDYAGPCLTAQLALLNGCDWTSNQHACWRAATVCVPAGLLTESGDCCCAGLLQEMAVLLHEPSEQAWQALQLQQADQHHDAEMHSAYDDMLTSRPTGQATTNPGTHQSRLPAEPSIHMPRMLPL